MSRIDVLAVSKRFGRVEALRQVSLTIAAGERVAFVGPNGSGKTTLLRAILGLLSIDGRVLIDGADVHGDPVRALSRLAYVPQVAPPIDVPVRDLLRTWARLRGVDASAVNDRAERLGLSIAANADKRFRDLSGGMKQKLLAALALASPASVLVCDEPTANLDPMARASFFAQIAERPAGDIVILCSHRIDEVRHLVHRVVTLREGVLYNDGSVGELLVGARAFRVEVCLFPGSVDAARFLVEAGFSAAGKDRFAALLTQGEKLSVVQRMVREHADALRDLSVYDAADVNAAGDTQAVAEVLS